jgi:hypothetical protein
MTNEQFHDAYTLAHTLAPTQKAALAVRLMAEAMTDGVRELLAEADSLGNSSSQSPIEGAKAITQGGTARATGEAPVAHDVTQAADEVSGPND